jgi:hypothetical protein
MNEAVVSAVAALTGSALGGLTPIISNYLIQRGLTQRELLTHELVERQTYTQSSSGSARRFM